MYLPFRPVSKTHSSSSSSSTIATRMINCILLFAFIFLVYLFISASRLHSKNLIHACYSSSSDQDQSKSLITKIDHVVFGIGSSTNSWPARREYVKLWWDAQKMRGCVFVDRPLPSSENHTDSSDLLPPVCISQDTSRFRYTWSGGDRNAIRIARCVLETVTLFNASSEEVRWYVFGDDDTIFIPENLARTLSKYDHTSWHYIGSSSEIYEQNSVFGHNMAFGGGGFALSSSLANVLARNFDSCIERYPHLYGGDSRVHVCVLELGVELSREPGFHQFDVRGNALGILTSHSTRPLVSLHHMAHIDPIFPNSTTFSAVRHLFSAVELDPLRIFQLSVCYDRWYSWTISVSWGYTVQIDSRHLLLTDALRTQETFQPWQNSGGLASVYTFNTREIHPDPCQRPVTFYMQHVSSSPHNGTIISVYKQAYENCTYDPITSPRKIKEIRVFSNRLDLDIRQLQQIF
ncbi:hypothetical protein CARUB_v10012119mg [Capsella rubella]|uniref:Uncharacterized protein n=1 Tax=Capsella rubella TaxID=81985 RepID=R0GPD1_9BRAS|nr:hypothetical protein CARUB_v10012119mg [Capsella rubella]